MGAMGFIKRLQSKSMTHSVSANVLYGSKIMTIGQFNFHTPSESSPIGGIDDV